VGTILFAAVSQLIAFTSPDLVERASHYWPGPTSVVLPLDKRLTYAHKGHGTLAFRIPDSPELVTLLQRTGPLATSSANPEGQSPPVTLAQAKEYFGDRVDFYVDGGDLSDRRPSRIIELLPDGSEKEIRT
jgi:L-threonylcarbamoyladenylate synthase